jgi:glutamyl-tRNA synthetase
MSQIYRGRIAPSPTGYLHLGHARTFWIAMERAKAENGILIFRNEDLDAQRCKAEYSESAKDDLKWFGCDWQEGPDKGGAYGPYEQSKRTDLYLNAWKILKENKWIYPCTKSRKDLRKSKENQGNNDQEPIYPEAWRPSHDVGDSMQSPNGYNWRFRVPDNKKIDFIDQRLGPCQFSSSIDFGDFLVWRKDGVPSYELSVVVDDAAMNITEVVRGEDLLISTARQLLIYKALGLTPPQFYHTPLVVDDTGNRLSKRSHSVSLKELKNQGYDPDRLRESEYWWSGLEDL